MNDEQRDDERRAEAGAPGTAGAVPGGATPGDGEADAAAGAEADTSASGAGDEAGAADDGGAAEVGADLDALLAETTRERDEYLALAQRARADFENFRKRAAAQTEEAEQRGRVTLARSVLPALDNLERALTAVGIDPAAEGATDDGEPPSREVSARDALAEGVALIYRELLEALERCGVSAFDPVGERFDPALHDAISTGAAEGVESGTVLETLERGYRVSEQVIRPARVVVAG